MRRSEYGQSRSRAGIAVGRLALIMLVVLTAAPMAAGASKKDKEDPNPVGTHVYQHTFDEVFQASLENIERLGYFVTDKDKGKGTISGKGIYQLPPPFTARFNMTFDILIESLNTNPETRVTLHAKAKGGMLGANGNAERQFQLQYSSELQKVLSTYH